jgi:hypothetical protein
MNFDWNAKAYIDFWFRGRVISIADNEGGLLSIASDVQIIPF